MSIIQQHRRIIEETAEQHGWSLLNADTSGFSKLDFMTFKSGQFMVSIETEVLHGRNYFNILYVKKYLGAGKFKTFRARRFHMKYIAVMSQINGDIHIKLKESR